MDGLSISGQSMVACGCQGSPKVPVGLKRCLQTAPGQEGEGPPMARSDEIGGPPRLINSGVGGMAQPLNFEGNSIRCIMQCGPMLSAEGPSLGPGQGLGDLGKVPGVQHQHSTLAVRIGIQH